MAISVRHTDNAGCPTLYLLFAGRHGQLTAGTGSLVAAFASSDEARAAFRQTRLRLSDREGWAELTMVADGAKAKPVSWFGQNPGRTDRPATWLLTTEDPAASTSHRRRRISRRLRRRG